MFSKWLPRGNSPGTLIFICPFDHLKKMASPVGYSPFLEKN